MSSFFKKKGGHVNAANVHMTEAEAALAQSDFNIEKITEIQNKFTGGAVLLVPGRIFIREGQLYKVCRKGLKKRQFFLFNDILVYGTIVASRYSNQQILPLAQMSVSSDCFYQPRVDADFISETDEENLDVVNAFQISHANKSFHVFGQSPADKANWIANLQKHISRVAKTLTDSHQQVLTRPVWVPDAMSKECMICSSKFSAFVRKHHCRRCGRVVCSPCSPHRVSLNVGEGLGLTPGGGASGESHQGKLERTCRECFKEMTAVHNRANSTSSSNSTKYDSAQSAPSRPPPPAVAAQIVSAALRSATSPPPKETSRQIDSSTDTEDSDDSGNEQENQKSAPIPAKRSSTKSEGDRPVPVARHSVKGEPSPPIPLKRPDHSPTLAQRSSDESSPITAKRTTNQIAESVLEDEPQPTPPPRKKKLLKQKLKEQQESLKQESPKQESPGQESPGQESPGQQHEDEKGEEDGSAGSPKKARRRNKYSKPHDEPKHEEPGDGVSNMPGEPVSGDGEPGEPVSGDGVPGEPVSGDGLPGEPVSGDNVEDEADGMERVESTDQDHTNHETPVGSQGGNEDVKASGSGDSSPASGEVGVKKGGRRRHKFKTTS